MKAISVDVGTSVIKAVGYDDDGHEQAVARRTCAVARPRPGHSEQDMEEVRRLVHEAIGETAESLGRGVGLVSVTAQGDGCWLVDSSGEPTGTAMLWNDARGGEQVARWQESGALRTGFERSGSMTFPGLSNALLAWCAEHEPARLEHAAAVLSCGGWVHAGLTGRVGIDSTDASAPFLPAGENAWGEDLFELFDLSWARHLYPGPLADDDRAAPVSAEVAVSLGLDPDARVVMAPYDVPCTTLGAGALPVGEACAILGTTLCTSTVIDAGHPVAGPEAGLRLRSGVPGHDLRVMPTAAGTGVLDWTGTVTGLGSAADVVGAAAHSEPGAHGLVFLPYLSPAGERAPFLDHHARGSLHGLSLEHTREDVARAVVEGLAHTVRECLESADGRPTTLRLAGGGARSDAWSQMIADLLGSPVTRCSDDEVGARGAYVAGLVATGAASDHAQAVAEHVVRADVLEPRRAEAERYAELHARYLRVRDHAASSWDAER